MVNHGLTSRNFRKVVTVKAESFLILTYLNETGHSRGKTYLPIIYKYIHSVVYNIYKEMSMLTFSRLLHVVVKVR